jgi:hypothetical protein
MNLSPLIRNKEIIWSISSKSDPRWNNTGTDTTVMMHQMPRDAEKWIKKCEKKFGKKPKDLTYQADRI